MINSWIEQRLYLDYALQALEKDEIPQLQQQRQQQQQQQQHPLAKKIRAEIEDYLKLTRDDSGPHPEQNRFFLVSNWDSVFDDPMSRFVIKFDSTAGGIAYLFDKKNQQPWASSPCELV